MKGRRRKKEEVVAVDKGGWGLAVEGRHRYEVRQKPQSLRLPRATTLYPIRSFDVSL